MIQFVRGNLFESRAEALVNTVNCVGVMGKGIAHQFKRAYPDMFRDYQRRCEAGEVRLGEVTTYRANDKLIINFPTKQHWRAKSRLSDIEAGLRSLRALIEAEKIRSVALPPLGCGNGGLAWAEVKRAIESELGCLDPVIVEVYEPSTRFESTVTVGPKLSLSHYVLAALRDGLEVPNRLTLQKSAYFFNHHAGEDYFVFEVGKFGPYAHQLEPMSEQIAAYLNFAKIHRRDLVEDGLRRRLPGDQADRLRGWLPVIRRTLAFCNRYPSDIEALATAHAVLVRAGSGLSDHQVVERFMAWSEQKRERFTETDVLRALATLESEGLAARTLLGWVPSRPQEAELATLTVELPGELLKRLESWMSKRSMPADAAVGYALERLLGDEVAQG